VGNQTLTINNLSAGGVNEAAAPPDPAFDMPFGVAVDGSGNIYVADYGNGTVYRFDAEGNQTLTIDNGSLVEPPDPAFVTPAGVAADERGNIFVADDASHTVYGFDADGNQTLTITGTAPVDQAAVISPEPDFQGPLGVAVDGAGNIYVADGGSRTVYRFAVDRVDLAVATAWATETVPVGDTTTLTVSVTNAGPCDASDVAVTAPLPAGLELVSVDAPAGTSYDSGTGVWTIGTLANDGEPVTLTLTVMGTAPGLHNMTATVATTSTNIGDESAEAAITVTAAAPPPNPVVPVPDFTAAPPATPVVAVPDFTG
jgi:uncharacterized repeat protein (TIGR01451 family)